MTAFQKNTDTDLFLLYTWVQAMINLLGKISQCYEHGSM